MKGRSRWRTVDLLLFTGTVIVSLVIPFMHPPWRVPVGLGFVAGAFLRLHRNRAVFVPALFFGIHAVLGPLVLPVVQRMPLQLPQISFLPSIVVYLVIVLAVPDYRRFTGWCRWGRVDRSTFRLGALLVLGSIAALSAWALTGGRDFTRYDEFIPDAGLGVLVLYGILFAVSNALFEEFFARAILYDGFLAATGRAAAAIVLQALVFALWHYNGFPGGVSGVALVFVWSVLLGWLRLRSGGMAAPVIVHIFADGTIGILLLHAVIL